MTTMTDNSAAKTNQAGWVTLGIGWLIFLLPLPGLSTALGGLILTVALIISIVVIAKGEAGSGIVQILANVLGSPVVYFVGVAIYGVIGSAAP